MSENEEAVKQDEAKAFRERRRKRNLATLAALLGFMVLVYVISLVRMGGL